MAQPMHVESGTINLDAVEVIDRYTGELGVVTQSSPVSGGTRRYVAEMLYGRSVMNGTAQFSLFGRAGLAGTYAEDRAITAGGSFRLASDRPFFYPTIAAGALDEYYAF